MRLGIERPELDRAVRQLARFHNNGIIYDMLADETSASGYGHITCKGTEAHLLSSAHRCRHRNAAPDAERRVEYFGVHGRCGCLAPAPSPRGQQPSVLVAIAMDGSPSPISWIGVLSLARGGHSNQFRTNDANLGHKPGDHELSIAPVIARKLGEHPEKHQLNDQWRSK
jgi:hypothetical protein